MERTGHGSLAGRGEAGRRGRADEALTQDRRHRRRGGIGHGESHRIHQELHEHPGRGLQASGVLDVPGAVISDAWEVDAVGYSSTGARPWDDVKLDVTRVVFDPTSHRAGSRTLPASSTAF